MPSESQYGLTLRELKDILERQNDAAIDGFTALMSALYDSTLSISQKAAATELYMLNVVRQQQEIAASANGLRSDLPSDSPVRKMLNDIRVDADLRMERMADLASDQRVTQLLNEAMNSRAAQVLGFAGDAFDAAKYATDLVNGNYDGALKTVMSWTLTTLFGGLLTLWMLAVGFTALPIALAVGLGMLVFSAFVDSMLGLLPPGFSDGWSNFVRNMLDPVYNMMPEWMQQAMNWIPRRDPLTLDLDGDGIESIGINSTNPILFDHDGDGVRTGTGWISSDDGFLVLDRNGDGAINSGRELFGDSTPIPGGTAEDGFAALAAEDTNGDGMVSAADARFADLRVWRDLNQDGVSQSGELFTLQQLGIVAINIDNVERGQTLSNGNHIADVGTYVRADGTEGTVAETHGTADVDLSENTFYRDFPDEVPLVAGITDLPKLRGSGAVRDLWEAASASPYLFGKLQQIAAAQTRDEQLALIDGLLVAWAETAGMRSMQERAEAIDHVFGYWRIGEVMFPGGGTAWATAGSSSGGGGGAYSMPADFPDPDAWEERRAEWNGLVQRTNNMFTVLEAFNGRQFFSFPQESAQGSRVGVALVADSGGGSGAIVIGPPGITIGIAEQQLEFLQNAYNALREQIYLAIALQTRLMALHDIIVLAPNPDGVGWVTDFRDQEAEIARRIQVDPVDGLADLIEYTRGMGRGLAGTNWRGWDLVAQYARSVPMTPEMLAMLAHYGLDEVAGGTHAVATNEGGILLGDGVNNSMRGSDANDGLVGGAGNDHLYGGRGMDHLQGDAGNDYLNGEGNDDVLVGGAGDDYMDGGAGNDIYVFGRGDGQDRIGNHDDGLGRLDRLAIRAGTSPNDLVLSRSSTDLVIQILDTNDRLTVGHFFGADTYALNEIAFTDGTVWNLAIIKLKVQTGTSGNDTLTAHETGSTIYAMEGNDTLNGGIGRDHLEGGNGDDLASGGAGDDTITDYYGANVLSGGDGNDTINGSGELVGGAGSDNLTGTGASTIYTYRLGDGHDTITDSGYAAAAYADTLQLGDGVTPASVTLERSGNDLVFRFSATDSITVSGWFADVYYNAIERVTFFDGTVWDQAAMQQMAIAPFAGTAGADTINGWDGIDTIDGMEGNDTLIGQGGNDSLQGSAGNDALRGGEGNDTLLGGEGNDNLQGENGADTMEGGAGDDTISDFWGANTMRGGAGADTITGAGTIEGGTGNDTLNGGGGPDIYLYNLGDGIDTITDVGYGHDAYSDTLQFGAGIAPAAITLVRSENDLTFRINDTDQVTVRNWFADVYYNAVERVTFADGTVWTHAQMQALTPQQYVATGDSETISGWDGIDLINGAEGNDTINALGANDIVEGATGNDTLRGGDGNDSLSGGDGNDNLQGENGDDTMEGGAGDDTISDSWGANFMRGGAGADTISGAGTIEGGAGNDTLYGGGGPNIYLYNLGDGIDTITDVGYGAATYADTLQLGAGISPASITLVRSGDDLTFRINDTDQVTVRNWFADVYYNAIERVNFADGTVWDQATLQTLAGQQFVGTSGNDTINGWNGIDLIDGAEGNDTINGQGGNDSLQGSAGDDVLRGGEGNDLLLGGDGNDNLQGENGDDTMEGGAGDDTITDYYGTNIARGGAGVDTINAAGTIEGGTGDDVLTGTGASTVYVFNVGDGVDTITDVGYGAPSYADTLQLGAGISPASITLVRNGDDMILRMSDTDQVVIKSWFADVYYYGLERVTFVDGTVWTHTQMQQMVPQQYVATAGNDTINGWDGIDLINGAEGNDAINSLGANDVIDGAAGNDALRGGEGNDVLLGGEGNDDLQGENGDDTLEGGVGDDTITDFYGVNIARGGAGVDTINAAGTIEGGTGDDVLTGTGASTVYVFNLGDGVDTITDVGYGAPSYADTLQLGAGITPASITLVRSGDDMILRMSDTDQVVIKNWFADVYYYGLERVTFADGTVWTYAQMQAITPQQYVATTGNDTINGWDGIDLINGAEGNDAINSLGANDVIDGAAGNDALRGGEGNDVLLGGEGNDDLQGENGDDTLEGGVGDDTITDFYGTNIARGGAGLDTINAAGTIEGGTGDDALTGTGASTVYVFNVGDGIDTITDVGYGAPSYADTLQLGAGITPASITLVRSGDDMILRMSDTDQVVIKNWFADVYYYGLERVTFADGTVWTHATLQQIVPQQYVATAGNDNVNGWDGIDLINGAEGNDAINGLAANDVIDGSVGNDTLRGGEGNDVLLGGEGNDNLQGENGDDTLEGAAGDDTITDFYGTNIARGGAGVDTINAAGTIEGGTGDDVLIGTGASTVYVFNLGDGVDTITDVGYGAPSYADTLQLGAGITPASITLVRSGDDLIFRMSVTDQVVVKNWYADVYYNAIERVTFADGTVWTHATMQQIVPQQYVATSGNDTLNGWDGIDLIDGAEGNDTIGGLGGNDTIEGAAGNDTLRGGEGNDVLLGSEGNDNLQGENGDDTLEGAAGDDTITDFYGTNIARGGAGVDTINAAGTIEGGTGDDVLIGTGASTVYVFNLGDGVDTITDSGYGAASYADTLQLGAGITPASIALLRSGDDLIFKMSETDQVIVKGWYASVYYNAIERVTFADGTVWTHTELALVTPLQYVATSSGETLEGWDGIDVLDSAAGNDLILDAGAGDQITFESWYTSTSYRSVLNLQMITEATAGFTPGGSDPLLDQRLERFNFAGVVNRFDQERTANPALTSWAVMGALLEFSSGGSDAAGLGGDLAHEFGLNRTFSGVGMRVATGDLNDAAFGTSPQNLNPSASVYSGTARLA